MHSAAVSSQTLELPPIPPFRYLKPQILPWCHYPRKRWKAPLGPGPWGRSTLASPSAPPSHLTPHSRSDVPMGQCLTVKGRVAGEQQAMVERRHRGIEAKDQVAGVGDVPGQGVREQVHLQERFEQVAQHGATRRGPGRGARGPAPGSETRGPGAVSPSTASARFPSHGAAVLPARLGTVRASACPPSSSPPPQCRGPLGAGRAESRCHADHRVIMGLIRPPPSHPNPDGH